MKILHLKWWRDKGLPLKKGAGLFTSQRSKSSAVPVNLSDFEFISNEHVRYQNGRDISGPDKSSRKGIRLQSDRHDKQSYTVAIFNLDDHHEVWGNNIQMAPKRMKIVEQNDSWVKLKGFGTDAMGNPLKHYGLTLHLTAGELEKVTLHMFARNVDIVYLSTPESQEVS